MWKRREITEKAINVFILYSIFKEIHCRFLILKAPNLKAWIFFKGKNLILYNPNYEDIVQKLRFGRDSL